MPRENTFVAAKKRCRTPFHRDRPAVALGLCRCCLNAFYDLVKEKDGFTPELAQEAGLIEPKPQTVKGYFLEAVSALKEKVS